MPEEYNPIETGELGSVQPAVIDGPPPEFMAAMMQMSEDDQLNKVNDDILARRIELHTYLRSWLSKSMMARRANYEDRWNRWRRNMQNIYDPAKKSRKERWQNTLFIPISMQNKEIIKSRLYTTLVSGLPQNIKPRPSGNEDEAKDLKALILRELERSKFEVAANDFFDDVCTYGSGFMKIFHERRYARRSIRVPQYEAPTQERLAQMQMTGEPLTIVGYQKMPAVPVQTYAGVSCWHVSIWDMFFSDNAKSVQSGPHAQRYKMSFQEILDGIKAGWAFPECANVLRDEIEASYPDEDKQQELSDKNISNIPTPRNINEREHTCYEWWGLLPERLLYLKPEDQDLMDDPDELAPAKVLFTKSCLIAADANEDYSAESPFESTGYLHVPGSLYHIGVAEMIEQIQDSINEDTNQRKDNIQLILNRMFAILERAIVSRADLVSRPGGAIRIKSNSTDDVNKAIAWLETPDVTASSYNETYNQERFAQELTGANRATIGSGGKDVTQTKGGLELIFGASIDRLMYYAQVIEADFITKIIRRYYKLIYSNMKPEEIFKIIGPKRAQFFQLRPPEEVEEDYYFYPEGVFSKMRQPIRIQQWQAFRDQYAGAPFFDDQQMAQILARAIELPDMDKIIVPIRDPITGEPIPFQMMQQLSMVAQMQSGQVQPPEGPGRANVNQKSPQMNIKKTSKNASTESTR